MQLGFDMDNRDYGIGAQILHELGISENQNSLRTIQKRRPNGLRNWEIVENIVIEIAPNAHTKIFLHQAR